MRLPFLAALIATASAATPSCARRGQFDLSSPSAALALIEPPVQMDLMRCLAICRLHPGCGSFASTGKRLPTDLCFIFKAGVIFEGVLTVPTTNADDLLPVWFWEVSCSRSPVGV
ncbi:hypothetical protein IQ06DRAFT_304691 [Phaeosphaeriaceae sp. SRC1lsM3a]|nr:hypothetical protein IQ06DRAFT_304691 [Stagonospora sp. SRC1lsM3a]